MRMKIGIDWCRSGWFAVKINEEDVLEERYELELYPSAYSIWHDITEEMEVEPGGVTVFIDIPIGLTQDGSKRACDTEARKKIGESSSVYPTPARDAAYEDTYPKAKSKNEERAVDGKSLGTQTWGIIPRIREVDEVLLDHQNARGVFYESHPELCFWALNGEEQLGDSKKSEDGEEKRERILREFESYPVEEIIDSFEEEYESRGSMVSVNRDDLYDALVLALCASADEDEYEALPGETKDIDDLPEDAEDLPMRMVYTSRESIRSA